MNYIVAGAWIGMAVLYFNRTRSLMFKQNEVTFVMMNILCGAIDLYASYVVATIDVTPLSLAGPLLTVIYMIMSRNRFEREKTLSEMGAFDDTPYPSVGP